MFRQIVIVIIVLKTCSENLQGGEIGCSISVEPYAKNQEDGGREAELTGTPKSSSQPSRDN